MNNFNVDPQERAFKKLRLLDKFIFPAEMFRSLYRVFVATALLAFTGMIFRSGALVFGCLCGLTACLVPCLISMVATRMKINYLKKQLVALMELLKQKEAEERLKKQK